MPFIVGSSGKVTVRLGRWYQHSDINRVGAAQHLDLQWRPCVASAHVNRLFILETGCEMLCGDQVLPPIDVDSEASSGTIADLDHQHSSEDVGRYLGSKLLSSQAQQRRQNCDDVMEQEAALR